MLVAGTVIAVMIAIPIGYKYLIDKSVKQYKRKKDYTKGSHIE
jgi:hypothetical protein